MHGLMGPAILITLGIVFLVGRHNGMLIPAAILIVIGVVKLAQANAPIDGHVNPVMYVPQPVVPVAPVSPAAPQTTTETEDRHV